MLSHNFSNAVKCFRAGAALMATSILPFNLSADDLAQATSEPKAEGAHQKEFSAGFYAMKYSLEHPMRVGVAVSRGQNTKHSGKAIAEYIERNFRKQGITAKVFVEEWPDSPGSVVTFTVDGVQSDYYHFGNMGEGFHEAVDFVRAQTINYFELAKN